MSVTIEHTLKKAGFSDGQVKVLTPVFEAVQIPAPEKTLAFQVAEVKGKISMLTWSIVLVATIFMAFSGFFYQKTFSDITNIQKDIQEIQINQVNMQRNIQDIKTLLEKKAVSSENI